MAKQSFVTGQVLTAAQLTSLQQTAMSGGAASAKTASYTLVAADAGTAISMTSTSATTITVNTGLFAAGDTVFIQNLGTANCTITAGTATVDTAGSLILPQYDAGILYFVSASSAVFYDYIQVGAASPLTTKGDLYGFSSSDARIPIGTNNQVLTADSAQALGLKWATPAAAASGLTLVKQQTIGTSVMSVSVTSAFSSTYDNYLMILSGGSATNQGSITMQLGATTTGYYVAGFYQLFGSATPALNGFGVVNGSTWNVGYQASTGMGCVCVIDNPNTAHGTMMSATLVQFGTSAAASQYQGFLNNTTSYTGFTLGFEYAQTGGEIRVYGYQNS